MAALLPVAHAIFSSERVAAITRGYLGSPASPARHVILTDDYEPREQILAEHFDELNSLKFYVYLDEIDEDNAPFQAIPGTHLQGKQIRQAEWLRVDDYNSIKSRVFEQYSQEFFYSIFGMFKELLLTRRVRCTTHRLRRGEVNPDDFEHPAQQRAELGWTCPGHRLVAGGKPQVERPPEPGGVLVVHGERGDPGWGEDAVDLGDAAPAAALLRRLERVARDHHVDAAVRQRDCREGPRFKKNSGVSTVPGPGAVEHRHSRVDGDHAGGVTGEVTESRAGAGADVGDYLA